MRYFYINFYLLTLLFILINTTYSQTKETKTQKDNSNHKEMKDHSSHKNMKDHSDHNDMENKTDSLKTNDKKEHVHIHKPLDPAQKEVADIKEKLGQFIDMGATFHDEKGKVITIEQILGKPTILILIFYHCTGACPILQSSTAIALSEMNLKPNKDYQVVTISFDPNDGVKNASNAKHNYMKLVGKDFPEQSWKFLSGTEENIRKVTESVGFYYTKDPNMGYIHKIALIILSPKGKITRYLYGNNPLPFNIEMALIEAGEGKIGGSFRNVVSYCFSYDPERKGYGFNIVRVSGFVTLFFLLIFGSYLFIKGRKDKN